MQSYDEKFLKEALTYDDVLLVPRYSQLLPRDTTTVTKLTRNIQLNIPLVSAAMDTVSEYRLAIAMAHLGGLAFIHKNMTISQQADQIRRVKRYESGMITDPITLHEDSTLQNALEIMRENKIGGIPIVDGVGKLTGILTNRDLRFQNDTSRSVKEVMTSDNIITAEEGCTLSEAETILQQHRIEKLPIVDKKGLLIGLITYRDIINKKDRPEACKDDLGRLRVGAAVGVTPDILDRVEALKNAGVDVVSIDTAHGHSKNVIDTFKEVKRTYSDLDVIVGNIASAEAAKMLADEGADAVKVGVGPGSICTTRIIAGVGMPQLTAVYDAAYALKGTDVPEIADGGIRFSGDLVKAVAGGANTIMIGSLLAGTEEAPGEVTIFQGRRYKLSLIHI